MSVSSIAPAAEGRRAAADATRSAASSLDDSFDGHPFAGPGVEGFTRQAFSDHDLSAPRFSEYRPPETAVAAVSPTPAPKVSRPTKGRYFVATLLVGLCGFAAYSIWNSFFRYAAYGVVEGRIVDVTAPWEGVVQQVYVREGDAVAAGQLLATLDNPDLRSKLLRLEEELRIAGADLTAESARLSWQGEVDADREQRALSDYYVAFAELQSEQAQLNIAACRLERVRALSSDDAIAGAEIETAEHQEAGQRLKVAKLEQGVAELRQLVTENEAAAHADPQRSPNRLRPYLLRIETLQNEIERASQRLSRGIVRAPTSGKIVACESLPGDRAAAHRPMLRIVAEGSIEIVFYASQDSASNFPIGSEIKARIAPHHDPVLCQVVRLGETLSPPPRAIARHYLANQQLLPVYLRPAALQSGDQLRLGSVAVLPRTFMGGKGSTP